MLSRGRFGRGTEIYGAIIGPVTDAAASANATPADQPLRDRHRAFAEAEAAIHAPVAAERSGAATGKRLAAEVSYLPYAVDERGPLCELVASYGPVEPEYATIRRGAALVDAAWRGTLEIRGTDRREFLQRMLTQDLKGLEAGRVVRSFWLNRKGRIESDLLVAELGDRIEVELPLDRAVPTVRTLGAFLFSEDVAIEDASGRFHRLELHGPAAASTLAIVGAAPPGEGGCADTSIAGVPVTIMRDDATGEAGFTIAAPRDRVGEVWDAIVAARDAAEGPRRRVRPVGWLAFNIARIEAGTPLFGIDFGVENLPHETGVIASRVSFRKGCYLGQEVVARMESLGKPKQILVGLRPERDLLPVAGGQVFELNDDGSMGAPVGTVTSSTISPLLGAAPIAFASVRTAHAEPGRRVLVNAEGEQVIAKVAPLKFWPEATA